MIVLRLFTRTIATQITRYLDGTEIRQYPDGSSVQVSAMFAEDRHTLYLGNQTGKLSTAESLCADTIPLNSADEPGWL